MCVVQCRTLFFFFKQKTAYEMRISDWSSDVGSSDLAAVEGDQAGATGLLKGCIVHIAQHQHLTGIDVLDDGGDQPAKLAPVDRQIGRASCRERVCQYV